MTKLTRTLIIFATFFLSVLSVTVTFSADNVIASKHNTPPLKGEMSGFETFDPNLTLPSVTFENVDGEAVKLEDFKGQVVLLNFWATWCPPCIDEMPSLDKLQAQLGSEKFTVIALSFDRLGPQRIKKFFTRNELENLEVFLDRKNLVAKSFDAYALPTTFLINKEGKIAGKFNGPANWSSPEAMELLSYYIAQDSQNAALADKALNSPKIEDQTKAVSGKTE